MIVSTIINTLMTRESMVRASGVTRSYPIAALQPKITFSKSTFLLNFLIRLLLIFLFLGWSSAHAHQSSTAYLQIQTQSNNDDKNLGGQLNAQYRLAIRDLAVLTPLDANEDLAISWGEIKAQQSAITQLLQRNVIWQAGNNQCAMNPLQQPFAMDKVAGVAYLVMYLAVDCADQQVTSLNYQMLAKIDNSHRLIISLSNGVSNSSDSNSSDSSQSNGDNNASIDQKTAENSQGLTESTNGRTWLVASGTTELMQADSSRFNTIKTYLQEGIHHLLVGFDHLLFLFCLLVTAVYTRQNKQWVPVDSARTAIRHTFYIATAFTVAHSITLTLAVLNIVSLPARWIESIIAFSIALAALNNLKPIFGAQQIKIAFLFGLVHGFGFANVLSELPLDSWSRGLALLSFNVGIEIGQLVCILIFFPLALLLRHSLFYRKIIFQAGSVLACILALIWMTQRILDLNWIPG